MSTDTLTRSDVEVIEALDFVPAVPCCAMKPGFPQCPDVAAWTLTCRWCGFSIVFCDGHLMLLRQIAGAQGWICCSECHRHSPTVEAGVIVTPLPKGGA